MRILGLHAGGHDTGACAIDAGRILAIGEERLSRVKNDGAFPGRAIEHVLGGAPLSSVDLIVLDVCDGQTRRALGEVRARGYDGPLEVIDHHLAHAASARFMSGAEEAAILVVDAGGTRLDEWPAEFARPASYPAPPRAQAVQSFFRASGPAIETLHQTFTRPGLRLGIGWLWALTTIHLGFGPLEAGKTMGLAAHAPPGSDQLDWVAPGGDLLFAGELDVADERTWSAHAERLFMGVPRRQRDEPLDERHARLAARLQRTTEALLLTLARQLHDATRARTLCLSGGVALNVLANRRLAEDSRFAEVVVQPAASDSGIALGCALYGAMSRKEALPEAPELSSYARPPRPSELRAAAERAAQSGFSLSEPKDLYEDVVERLVGGQVIGWFDGASELGPRALGRRSLLADPRDPGAKDRVNALVKHREAFRPFAPVVLEERAAELFDLHFPSRNMLFSAAVLPEARGRVPAITHVDGTARVQTVSRSYPGRLRALLERFDARTGVPALLNTSLNGPGEPIAETAEDALALFARSDMHALVLDGLVLARA
ncbi:MAG: hypothetical protein OZ921_04900 [Sorangiineae bacterium]|nr:hypothetical protein [Polyangiaceae bacterium]MEB2321829.1 hypothetical protein [Sorangiineae bacterium]